MNESTARQVLEAAAVHLEPSGLERHLLSPAGERFGPLVIRQAMLDRGVIDARDRARADLLNQVRDGSISFFESIKRLLTGRFFSLENFRRSHFPTVGEHAAASPRPPKEGVAAPYQHLLQTPEALYHCLGIQEGYFTDTRGNSLPPVVQVSHYPLVPGTEEYLDRKKGSHVGFHDSRKIALAGLVFDAAGHVGNSIDRKTIPTLLGKAVKGPKSKVREVVWTNGSDHMGAALKEDHGAVAILVDAQAQVMRLLLEEYLSPDFTLKTGIPLPPLQEERAALARLVGKACGHTMLHAPTSDHPSEA